jgi:hypothetical protein
MLSINATLVSRSLMNMQTNYSKTKPLPRSCDTFVVVPRNKQHPIIFGKNSDRPDDEGTYLSTKIRLIPSRRGRPQIFSFKTPLF